jgi:hypothetical protein
MMGPQYPGPSYQVGSVYLGMMETAYPVGPLHPGRPCKYFSRRGFCRVGDKCRFMH